MLFFLHPLAEGQEVVSGLQYDRHFEENNRRLSSSKGLSTDTLTLPFFDDFTGPSFVPDESKWSDAYVLVNNTYSINQITQGIATMDALGEDGRLYESSSPTVFEADHLSSQPVDLNNLPADNVYLSFFYQAGGLADKPEPADSLIIQFYAPLEEKWYSVWKAPELPDDFKAAIIRIDNPRFLKKGFRFRFINYASLSPDLNDPSLTGNCDHWHIDYVVLDRNRHSADTLFQDVAFRLPLRSLLKTYEAMPWNQFRQVYLREMGSSIPVSYRNNDNIVRNVTRLFNIRDLSSGITVHEFSAGATNIAPLSEVEYNAALIYTFNSPSVDSAFFQVTATLKTDDFDPKVNDTLRYRQVFGNYFAYDDGSAEGGYGINGLGSGNAMVACRFESFLQDTVRAVSICFNDSYLNANRRLFDIVIWDDAGGRPGNIIYTLEEVMVEQGDNVNGFYTYILPDGVMVDDVFYVGWKQRSETFLNAGYDINTGNMGRLYYWLNGDWHQSQVPGSVMIRPVMGPKPGSTGIDDIPSGVGKSFRIWPNPASDYLNIDAEELPDSDQIYVSFFDLHGREVMKTRLTGRIDLSSLPQGIYIVVTSSGDKPAAYNRLIITR